MLLAGCTGSPAGEETPSKTPSDQGALEGQGAEWQPDGLAASIDRIGTVPSKDLKPVRLADGLIPPTNHWFSGLVFGDDPQPVYPLPLSFALSEDGLTFGLPAVTTTEKTIMGTNAPMVQVSMAESPTWQVVAYDALSVTAEASSDGSALGRVTVVQGSPYITYTAIREQELSTQLPFEAGEDYASLTSGDGEYVAVSSGGSIDAATVTLPADASVTWGAVPEGGDPAVIAKLAAPVTATAVAYEVGEEVRTTLSYETEQPTVVVRMPHQQNDAATCELGTYASSYGALAACEGNDISWETTAYEARAELDLSGVSGKDADELKAALTADVAAAKDYPADTYFGGKALYRDAQLYSIARQLGAEKEAAAVRERVRETLVRWANPDGCQEVDAFCFGYDETNRGIVGQTPSFGSDEFNDHHFHYGYFLYAAGVLGADDPELVEQIRPVMNLLAADIASAPANEFFPERRTFDAYASHSWASGTSPFADGNNQESSSEAVLAWAGLTLWAQVSGQTELEQEATWMHALEGQSARAYWTDFDESDPVYDGYAHTVLPLNFGGKRDYATWFSPEPAAIMAILVIPASPSSDHLAGDPERIERNVTEATSNGGFNQMYGDYLLMYSALAGEEARVAALEEARNLDVVDDGNTRTYLLAWLMSLKA
ncbi:MAG: glycosyl hydrolase [Propionibacteriaceae bacterium]|nr:glycosyl hydrolase [Propionibacteriaceae bacterium]